MDVLYSVPARNLNNASLNSGLINVNNLVPIANCGGLLLRYEVINIDPGESITFTYSIFVDGVFRSGSSTVVTQVGTGSIGFDVGGKNTTTQVQASLQSVGTVRISATLYSIQPGEDIV